MTQIQGLDLDVPLLRQALALALLKEKPLTIIGIDELVARRPLAAKLLEDWAGLYAQTGMGMLRREEGSLLFEPGRVTHGNFELVTGNLSSAVETALLLMPALFYRPYRSRLSLRGVSHSGGSLSTDEVRETLLGLLEKMGFYAGFSLKRFGFFGSGGGLIEAKVYPEEARRADPFNPAPSAALAGARVYVSRFPTSLAREQKSYLARELSLGEGAIGIMEVMAADGPGNAVQTYVGAGASVQILSSVIDPVGRDGTPVKNEGEFTKPLDELARETMELVGSGTLPVRIVREVLPYCILSGCDAGDIFLHERFRAHRRVYDAVLQG